MKELSSRHVLGMELLKGEKWGGLDRPRPENEDRRRIFGLVEMSWVFFCASGSFQFPFKAPSESKALLCECDCCMWLAGFVWQDVWAMAVAVDPTH